MEQDDEDVFNHLDVESFQDHTHPKTLNFDHVSWTTFARDLTLAGQSIFSQHPATYEGVHALLMNWVDDDLGTNTELSDMNALFQNDFQYSSEMWKIPAKGSEQALEQKLSDVKRDFGNEKRLLIVYYGGHGCFDSNGRSIWQAGLAVVQTVSKIPSLFEKSIDSTLPETNMDEANRAEWLLNVIRHITKGSPKLNWSSLQPMLLRAPCDVLILLDCCYAGSAARTDISGTNEILAACGRESTTLGVGAGSFTAKILRKIRSFNGKPFTVEQLYQRLLKDRKRMDITPQYAPLSGRRGLSIVLARMESKLTENDLQVFEQSSAESGSNESEPMTSASTSLVPSLEMDTSGPSSPSEGPRVLLALSLTAEASVPDLEEWKIWLSTNAPEEIRGLEVTLERAYSSHSTLVLVSVPICVWNHLPDTSAYRFVGFITSENLLAPKAKQSGGNKDASTLKEKAVTKDSSSIFSDEISDSSTIFADEGHPFAISDPGTLSKPGRLSSTLHSQPTLNVSKKFNAPLGAFLGDRDRFMQRLSEKKADVNAQDEVYVKALQMASSEGHEEIVQTLLDKGADVNAQGGRYGNALQAASSGGHDKVVQMLLDKGADVNAQGRLDGNALQLASSGGHERVVQMLVDQGADINAQGGHYGNALQAASSGGHDQVVQMLLDQGADVNAQGGRYGNALQAASYRGHEKVVQMLLDKGADVNAQGGLHGNALQQASSGGHQKVVQLLSSHGAVVSGKDL